MKGETAVKGPNTFKWPRKTTTVGNINERAVVANKRNTRNRARAKAEVPAV